MRKIVMTGVAAVLGIGLAVQAQAAGDAAAGKAKFAVCAGCHGQNGEGNQALNAPVLAGQEGWYVARQIQNFKAGIRGTNPKDAFGMQMRPMAMTLATDQDIEDVAAYASSLPKAMSAATVKGDAKAGKTAFAVCVSCHGADGKGNKVLNAPGLVGQADWYILRQLQNFKASVRGADAKDTFGMQMRPMSMTLTTDQAINDVAAYITTLK